MFKMARLLLVALFAVSMVRSDSVPAAPSVDVASSKIYIDKPILLEVNHAGDENTKLGQDTENDVNVAKELETPKEDLSSKVSSVQLNPIPLMMMPQLPFGMPQFMQQILDSLKSADVANPDPSVETDASSNSNSNSNSQSSEESGVRHGSLTILLMKSLKPASEDKSGQDVASADQEVAGAPKRIILYKFMPKYRFGGKGDPDNDPNFMNSLAKGDDNTKKSVHLLGSSSIISLFFCCLAVFFLFSFYK